MTAAGEARAGDAGEGVEDVDCDLRENEWISNVNPRYTKSRHALAARDQDSLGPLYLDALHAILLGRRLEPRLGVS